jgi:hypothetical protein
MKICLDSFLIVLQQLEIAPSNGSKQKSQVIVFPSISLNKLLYREGNKTKFCVPEAQVLGSVFIQNYL